MPTAGAWPVVAQAYPSSCASNSCAWPRAATGRRACFTAESGSRRLTMLARPAMVDGFKFCHGGDLSSCADSVTTCTCEQHVLQAAALGRRLKLIGPTRVVEMRPATGENRLLAGRTGGGERGVGKRRRQTTARCRKQPYRLLWQLLVGLADEHRDAAATSVTICAAAGNRQCHRDRRWPNAERRCRRLVKRSDEQLTARGCRQLTTIPLPRSTKQRAYSTAARNPVNERSLYL